MKKLVFLFVAFAAVSFASCGNKAAQSEEATDSVEVAVEEVVETVDSAVVADSAVVDSTVVAE